MIWFTFFLFILSVTQLHFIPVDLGSPIVHCSVADPYVVIMTAEGVVTMFALKTDSYMGKTHRLALQKPQIPTVSQSKWFYFVLADLPPAGLGTAAAGLVSHYWLETKITEQNQSDLDRNCLSFHSNHA